MKMNAIQNIMMNKLGKLTNEEVITVYTQLFMPLDQHDSDIDDIYNFIDYEEVIWNNGYYLYIASLEIMQDMDLIDTSKPIHFYFPEEDARGTFELISGYSSLQWWERAAFGKITDSYFINCYEFCTYEINKKDAVYVEYKLRSFRCMMQNMVKSDSKYNKVFQRCPKFWFDED